MTQGRTGRRPGNPDTRADILEAAAEAFIAHGYDGASVRGIARAADVDPALIHRWFGGKEGLMLAVVQSKFDLEKVISSVLAHGQDDLARHLLTTIIGLWESPAGQAIIQTIRQRPALLPVMVGYIAPRYADAAITLGMPRREAELRGSLVVSQMVGLAAARYLARIEPLASLPASDVVRLYAPLLDQALNGRHIKSSLAGHVRP